METYLCTTATVNRWSYIMFSLCCPLYGLELLPGKHCPVEEMVKTIAGSITTTMSVCSGDTGYSREMARDVTKEERDHLLKAWKKANMKVANSVEEWERLGYQEQLGTDDVSSENSEKGGL